MERIPADGWQAFRGHLDRYRYAASQVRPGEHVNDIGCGIGYGAMFLDAGITYDGYDKPGVGNGQFFGMDGRRFYGVDLDAPDWMPVNDADVTYCIETLEHLLDAASIADTITATTRRAVIVSVPTVPTVGANPYHRRDFTVDDIPPLFPELTVTDQWDQPTEVAHVWLLER
jgi:hypothetical protein